MKSTLNGNAKWIIVAISIAGLVFNSGVLYNDVAHLTDSVKEMRGEIRDLRNCLMGNGLVLNENIQARTD